MATVTLPDDLAKRVQAFGRWLPAILEISLLGLKTPARDAADTLIAFFKTNPSAQEVWAYHLPEAQQKRIERLLEGERENALSEREQLELDEFMRLEQTVRLIKARLASGEFSVTPPSAPAPLC